MLALALLKNPPHVTTVCIYGSTTKPFPNSSATIIVSTDPKFNPPSSSEKGRPKRPSSENCFQFSCFIPSSDLTIACLLSKS